MLRTMRVLLFCLLTSALLLGQNKKVLVSENTILWSPNRIVLWDDFQGERADNILAYAVTGYKIEIVPENVMVDEQDRIQGFKNLTVVANFYKNESWTISNDPTLLKHERLHFDIAELYARKIRRRFKELQAMEEARFSIYSEEYKILWKECMNFQKQFEKETKNGVVESMNIIWSKKVERMPNALSDYSSKLEVAN